MFLILHIKADGSHCGPQICILREKIANPIIATFRVLFLYHSICRIEIDHLAIQLIVPLHRFSHNEYANCVIVGILYSSYSLTFISHLGKYLVLSVIVPIKLLNNEFGIFVTYVESIHPFLEILPILAIGHVHYEKLNQLSLQFLQVWRFLMKVNIIEKITDDWFVLSGPSINQFCWAESLFARIY